MRAMILALAATATVAVPAVAQDAFMPGTSPMDLAPQSQALTSSVIGNLSVGDTARRGGGGRPMPMGQAGSPRGGGIGFVPGGQVSDARIPYASTAASRSEAMSAYIARAQKKNPKAAAVMVPELRRRNVHAELAPALARYGLRIGDVADVMTAFLVVGWDAATGGDANSAQVRGVRRQVAGQLVGIPALRNPATRTRLAEELKITTYIVSASGGSARRDGDVAQYRRGVAAMYRQITGQDISGWRLTPAGFRR